MKKILFLFLAVLLVVPSFAAANTGDSTVTESTGMNGTFNIEGEEYTFTDKTDGDIRTILIEGQSTIDELVYNESTDTLYINGEMLEKETIEGLRAFVSSSLPGSSVTPYSTDPGTGGTGGGKWIYVSVANGTINVSGMTVPVLAGILTASILKDLKAGVAVSIAGSIIASITDDATSITYKRYKYRYEESGWKHFKYNTHFFYMGKYITQVTWTTARNF